MTRIPSDYIEKCYAGWLGKIIGVRHGAPIEGWTYDKVTKLVGEIDGYMVDYRDFAADDDSNGPMFFLRALEDYTYTRDITAEQIGLTWLNYAPYEHGFYWWGGYGISTEHTAYLNLRAGTKAPRSGSVEQNGAAIAEQIGGQIFIDTWGLVVPNNPELAAEYAQKAASVGHGGNGVYGGMFVAAAISAAFTAKSIDEIINKALSVIPQDCEYTKMTQDIRKYYASRKDDDWRKCFDYIYENWGYDRYPGACHIIPNSAVIIMSLLYGKGDFDHSINVCNMAGWDTDCNVANVGTILGTFLGLDGIDYDKWRKPINDFIVTSSVVGSMNIMDLPGCVRTISSLAYKIAGEKWEDKWDNFLNDDAARFNFELPGSTQAFRAEGSKEILLKNDNEILRNGQGSLKALFKRVTAGDKLSLYYGTYYRPDQFHNSRYDPCFSPILYPGQTITAWVMSDAGVKVRAGIYVWDGNNDNTYQSEEIELVKGEWTLLTYVIPSLDGVCLEKAGILITPLEGRGDDALIYVDKMDFSGVADYTLDFSKERIEVWEGHHREVSQMSKLKGVWDLEGGCLTGSCADFGEAYTGDVFWENYGATCTLKPMNDGLVGFNFRTQGAIRSYSLAYYNGKLMLQKNNNGYSILASVALEWNKDEYKDITVRVEGNIITAGIDGKELLSFEDTDNPYLNGMVGLRVEKGGRVNCSKISIRP